MDGTLEQVKAALHASSFDLAETGFRAILGGADGIEALHCLGLIALQRGDLAGALMLIQAAHHLAPSARMAHNLAVVLSGLGRTDEAIAQALAAANLVAAPEPLPKGWFKKLLGGRAIAAVPTAELAGIVARLEAVA